MLPSNYYLLLGEKLWDVYNLSALALDGLKMPLNMPSILDFQVQWCPSKDKIDLMDIASGAVSSGAVIELLCKETTGNLYRGRLKKIPYVLNVLPSETYILAIKIEEVQVITDESTNWFRMQARLAAARYRESQSGCIGDDVWRER